MKIGIFDSGFGGLSVLCEAKKRLGCEEFLYYADRDNVPYGSKTSDEILDFSLRATEFMVKKGVKAVVVACNTATSVAIRELRAKFDLPIIGMEPAVKKAVDSRSKTIVIATEVTIKGAKLKELIVRVDGENLVDLLGLNRLVEFAEKEEFSSPIVTSYLKNEFGKFDLNAYSSVVLGCTHFNYFKDSLREILPMHIRFLDGNEGTISKLISELDRLNLRENLPFCVDYYYSGREVSDKFELDKINRYLVRVEKMALIR